MNISASEFVKQYCKKSGIAEREFYETQVPMPDPTSPYGWAAVSNNPLSIKAHVDLYSGKPPAPEAYDTDWQSCRERAARADAVPSVGISLVSIAKRTAGLLRQLDYEPNAESENPIEVLLFDAEKVESDIKEMKKNRAAMFRPHSVGRYFYATWAVPDENGLLPCPFCGSHASSIDDRLRFTVRCQNKGCGFVVIGPGVPELQTEEEAEKVDWAALEQQAKDKWNGAIPQVGNFPAHHDCCPAQNSVAPAQSHGWIPVSERMPESNGVYFGWDGKRVLEVYCFFGGFSANQFIHGEITHWMPLPAAPQEAINALIPLVSRNEQEVK